MEKKVYVINHCMANKVERVEVDGELRGFNIPNFLNISYSYRKSRPIFNFMSIDQLLCEKGEYTLKQRIVRVEDDELIEEMNEIEFEIKEDSGEYTCRCTWNFNTSEGMHEYQIIVNDKIINTFRFNVYFRS